MKIKLTIAFCLLYTLAFCQAKSPTSKELELKIEERKKYHANRMAILKKENAQIHKRYKESHVINCAYIDTSTFTFKSTIKLGLDTITEINSNKIWNVEFNQNVLEELKFSVSSFNYISNNVSRYKIKEGYYEYNSTTQTITKYFNNKKVVFQECK